MAESDRQRLVALSGERDWIWIAGNHDPEAAAPNAMGWAGRVAESLAVGGLVLRHEAISDRHADLSGHFHPKASIRARTGRVRARCFVENGRRLILPAFGAYTGGLDATSPAIRRVMGARYRAHLIGRDRIYAFPSTSLLPGRPQPARLPA
jgi:hypothetical protein